MTDGPFVETKDLIAGWYIIDVESSDRVVRLAGSCRRPRARRQADLPMAGGSAVSGRPGHGHRVNEPLPRDLVPAVIGVLVRAGQTSRRPRPPCRTPWSTPRACGRMIRRGTSVADRSSLGSRSHPSSTVGRMLPKPGQRTRGDDGRPPL